MASVQPAPTLETLKARSRETWTAGDFGKIAQSLEPTAEAFIDRRSVGPGMRVLDVACGTGNLAVPAARAGADVVGVDIAANLIAQARERARAESLAIRFEEGDAEDLAFADASFDQVVSMFGAMFAPRPDRAAAEMLRVCRPGGQVAMANWTARGFSGQMFKLVAGYVPPPPVPAPTLWGDDQTARERLRDESATVETRPMMAEILYPFDPAAVVDYFRAYFGPVRNAFEALPEDRRESMHRDMVALWTEHNQARDGTTRVNSEYLEVVATRG